LQFHPLTYAAAILAGLCSFAFGTILLQNGIRRIGSGLASVFSVFEPVSTILLGFCMLGNVTTPRQMLACATIILSVFFLMVANYLQGRSLA
jgi:drug/metabolite transporter (DMT)-like permease